MPTTPKFAFPYPAGTDPVSKGAQNIQDLAAAVDGGVAWVPAGGASGAVLAKIGSGDYAAGWTTPHYVPAGGAAGQVLAKADASDYSLAWQTPAAGGAGGTRELAYVPFTAPVAVTASTEASSQLVVAAPAVVFDGTPIFIEFYAPTFTGSTSGTSTYIYVTDGSAALGVICRVDPGGSSNRQLPALGGRFRLSPSGSVTYTVRAYNSGTGATNTIQAGNGGSGVYVPGFVRIVRA